MLRWLWISSFLVSACASTRPEPARSSDAPPPAVAVPASTSESAAQEPPSASSGEPAPPAAAPPLDPFVKAQVNQASVDAASMASAVTLWQAQHGDDSCPSFASLVRDGVMSPETSGVDPWNNAYSIACDDSAVSVTSSGPDGRPGTADDVVAEKP